MKRPLRHIIKDFINSLNLTFSVNSYSEVDGITTIIVDNVLYLRKGLSVTINEVDYVISSVSSDTTFSITGIPAAFTQVTFPSPYFYSGTPLFVLQQLQSKKLADSKYPFIYLYEIIEEDFSLNRGDRIERQADVRLFFLDESTNKWDATANMDDYYVNVVDGQYRLAHYFIEQANNGSVFARIEDRYRVFLYPKFGAFNELKGATSSIFNDVLSGVELRVNLPVLQELNC